MSHVFTCVCVIRRWKMVEGMVGGKEDRMTMKTSDLPVCLLYILLCCMQCIPKRPPQSHPHCTRLYSTTSLCAPRESNWVAGRRTVDDLRSRATNLNNFSKLFRRPYDYNAGKSWTTNPHALTHTRACFFWYMYNSEPPAVVVQPIYGHLMMYIIIIYWATRRKLKFCYSCDGYIPSSFRTYLHKNIFEVISRNT